MTTEEHRTTPQAPDQEPEREEAVVRRRSVNVNMDEESGRSEEERLELVRSQSESRD